jgi:hypothetical protein
MLCHVHEFDVMARIVVKVSMNSERQVPPSIVVGVGDGTNIRTWTVPVYILLASDITALGDEDEFPLLGPLRPLPPSASHWMGPTTDYQHDGESRMDDNVTLLQPHPFIVEPQSGGHGRGEAEAAPVFKSQL